MNCIESLRGFKTFILNGAFLMAQKLKNLPTNAEDTGDKLQSLVNSRSQEDPLEKEMATHSSILPCKSPWTEEPGGVQSMRLQRVGHN